MAAFLLPSWQLDFSGPQGRAPTVHEIRQQQRSSVKRRKVKFAPQLHTLTKVLLPSPSVSRPTGQVRGSLRCRSPSPFPRGRVAEEVKEIEGQPEGDVLDEPSRPASRASNASTNMWGPPISYLDDCRQGRSPSRPVNQGVQARRKVKVITPSTSKAQPQSASIEKMPSTMVNDKTPLLADTNTCVVDANSEEEDVTVTAIIQQLNPHSSNEMPVINSTRPFQYLGVNQDDISFYRVGCGLTRSNKHTPLEKSAAKTTGLLPVPRHRYFEYTGSRASFGVGSSTTINTGAVCNAKSRSGYDTLTTSKSQKPSLPLSSSLGAGQSLPAGSAGFVDYDTVTRIASPVTYSEVVAVNETQSRQKSLSPKQRNMSQESPSIGSATLKFSSNLEVATLFEAQEASRPTTNRIWSTSLDTGTNLGRVPTRKRLQNSMKQLRSFPPTKSARYTNYEPRAGLFGKLGKAP
ncbi:hypothetical protein QBC32DRAFT_370641 [Pseudoneurospora amorphoporcata]|uniref:Uncharacterized protein n=1 Tax=Pseudoneurospora amorphoporcata TaxID=241081 RepID=A0AAN6NTY3_9PEZI|nr:hypothetical protein QBC32DRAFT_370641 [Pseudoneurospora amorphoporcata]